MSTPVAMLVGALAFGGPLLLSMWLTASGMRYWPAVLLTWALTVAPFMLLTWMLS